MAEMGGAESLFDHWAARYDAAAQSGEAFPFAGYEATLDRVVALAAADRHQRVLDLGIGTGNLAARFVAAGCSVWGIDLSSEMLAIAETKLPGVHLHHGDFLRGWPIGFPERFERIVSTYAFHHVDDREKVELIARLLRDRCTEDGLLAIGDISFATREEIAEEEQVWSDLFDPDEHYWVADEAISACEAVGIAAVYEQTSRCAGVYVFRNPVTSWAQRREPQGFGQSEFSYRATKGGVVFISRCGRVVTRLRHDAAREFLADAERASLLEQQDLMARYTGNYKRGNERLAERHPRHGG